MIMGMYVLDEPKELTGATALLQRCGDGFKAQFDNLEAFGRHEKDWAFGWHEFSRAAFKITHDED